MKPKIAITIRNIDSSYCLFNKIKENFDLNYINITNKRLSEEEVISAIKEAEVAIAGTEPYNKNVLNSTDKLKVISRVGVGLDNIDLNTASDKNIIICNTPNAPTQAVAEHTIALILDICKNIVTYNLKDNRISANTFIGKLLSGKTIGIIGLGRIGRTVGKLLSAFGCEIGYYDPYLKEKETYNGWINYSSIDELLEKSDIVTLHMPPKDDKSPILDKKSFEHFKKGAILINTARSSLIDEKAFLDAIDKGIITGAGLDVYDTIIEDQIQNYPQIILTPHVASNTKESREEMEKEAIENLINAFKGINP
ncbi:NAD(P)-dependent oxidoreductase [Methanoplanus limicola]|uniref:D-isomer specific 2-hydroxyacid dehydrogenase NAD-binding n=1 Tax=Methanoplanus limicola DSM 2279 TaxID=937775 RepID=H1YXC8_9EURY|nr:NAD(P)-dependent oxidoreductase [Methanoplanus limicola]EHQ36865.1 D-isomer specific 2-hydroxyacid dehydrogenase NAD-binding [Methanoplanus limicola DSM 2279]